MIRAAGVDQAAAHRGGRRRLCGRRGRHPLPQPGPARRRPARRQHGRAGPRRLGRHSSASHARDRTTDRCAGHRGFPHCRRPAAAPAEGVGRAIQGDQRTRSNDAAIEVQEPDDGAALALLLPPRGAAPRSSAGTVDRRVPQLATPENVATPAGDTRRASRARSPTSIAADLRSSRELMPIGRPKNARVYSYPEATAPTFTQVAQDRRQGAGHRLRPGAVRRPAHRRLLPPRRRRRAASSPARASSSRRRLAPRRAPLRRRRLRRSSPGAPGIVRHAHRLCRRERRRRRPVKRIAIMDSDGTNHRYLTAGDATVLTPRLSPDGERLAYVSFAGGQPQVRLIDLRQRRRPAAAAGRCDELRAALLARRQADRLLDGDRTATPTSMSPMPTAAACSG